MKIVRIILRIILALCIIGILGLLLFDARIELNYKRNVVGNIYIPYKYPKLGVYEKSIHPWQKGFDTEPPECVEVQNSRFEDYIVCYDINTHIVRRKDYSDIFDVTGTFPGFHYLTFFLVLVVDSVLIYAARQNNR